MISQQPNGLEIISAENATRIGTLSSIGGGSIRKVAYSPDGNWLAAGSSIGVWLYQSDFNTPPQLLGKDQCGYRVAFSNDSKLIASPGRDRKILFWEIADGKAQDYFQFTLDDDFNFFHPIAFHPDGKRFAVGVEQKVLLWDLERKELLTEIARPDLINSLSFSSDGLLLAIGGFHSSVSIQRMTDGLTFELPQIHSHRDQVQVAFGAKGQFAYGSGGIVVLWDIQAQKELKRFTIGAQGLESLAFSNDETMLATAHWAGAKSGPGAIRILDLTTGGQRIIAKNAGVSVSFRPDNQKLAFARGGWDSTIEYYDLNTEKIFFFPAHGMIASGLAVSSDSKTMAYGASKGIIRLIDLETGQEKNHLQKQEYDSQSASGGPITFVSDDPNLLVFNDSYIGTDCSVWDTHSGNVTSFVPDINFMVEYLIPECCMSANHHLLVIGSTHEKFIPYGEKFSESLLTLAEQAITFSAAITLDKRVIVAAKKYQETTLHEDIFNGIDLELDPQRRGWSPADLSATDDGSIVAGAGRIGSGNLGTAVGWLWDLRAGKQRFAFQSAQYYGAEMRYALFNPAQTLVVFADGDGTIFIWDVEKAIQLHQFRAHPSGVWNMRFTPDGTRLITLGSDGTIRIWGIL